MMDSLAFCVRRCVFMLIYRGSIMLCTGYEFFVNRQKHCCLLVSLLSPRPYAARLRIIVVTCVKQFCRGSLVISR